MAWGGGFPFFFRGAPSLWLIREKFLSLPAFLEAVCVTKEKFLPWDPTDDPRYGGQPLRVRQAWEFPFLWKAAPFCPFEGCAFLR